MATLSGGTGFIGPGLYQRSRLGPTEIQQLPQTPCVLAPAPPPGFALVPFAASASFAPGSRPYTNGGNLALQWGSGATYRALLVQQAQLAAPAASFSWISPVIQYAGATPGAALGVATSVLEAQPLLLVQPSGPPPFAGGNGLLTVEVIYYQHTL